MGEYGVKRTSTFEVISGRRAGVAAAALLLTLALGGCASTIADLPMVGTPTGAPARPTQAGEYLPVHDVPTSREGTAMAPAEQAKIQAELIAARDRQAVATPATPAGK
ncbi:MAG: hypothetical protein JWQ94_1998 [Tardiphaga sp.]|nr:hypothetical protein [Tardiphaga sp.]